MGTETLSQKIERLESELAAARAELAVQGLGAAPTDFSFIRSKMDRDFLEDAYQAVTVAGLWSWLATVEPERGYMFSSNPEIAEIQRKMSLGDSHSGASFGITMRNMQYIAKNGLEGFKDLWLSNNPHG